MTVTEAPSSGRDAARALNRYARTYHAGAFATPTAKELDAGGWIVTDGGWLLVEKHLTRPSQRTGFDGKPYVLPAGARVVTHLAPGPGDPPDWSRWDFVHGYTEDPRVRAAMRAAGRSVTATKVTAASELITCWGPPGHDGRVEPVDRHTLTRIPMDRSDVFRRAVDAELALASGWADDYPFYSDGSWGALNLRGFWPDDPTRGVKPAEMSKSWKDNHPADLRRRCDWTTLAHAMPATVQLAQSLSDWLGPMERVRLLRMAGRGGKGGSLARHTDITDKASGTRNGHIIRFHIPIRTDPRITMSAWNLDGARHDVHLPAWSLWYLDARKPHAVDNRAGTDRIHLVIDVHATDAARAAICSGADHAA